MLKKKPDRESGLKMRTHVKLYIKRGSNGISSIIYSLFLNSLPNCRFTMCAPLNFMFSFTYILVITFDDYSSPFFLGHIELWIFTYCDDWVCLPSLMLPLNSESITRPWWPAPKPDFPRGVRLSGCSTGRSRASKESSWTLLNFHLAATP